MAQNIHEVRDILPSSRGDLLRLAKKTVQQFEYRITISKGMNIGFILANLSTSALKLLICLLGKHYYKCVDDKKTKSYADFIGSGRALIPTISELQRFLNEKSEGTDRNICEEVFEDCFRVLCSLVTTKDQARMTYAMIGQRLSALSEWFSNKHHFTRDESRYAILCCFSRAKYRECLYTEDFIEPDSISRALHGIFNTDRFFVVYCNTAQPFVLVSADIIAGSEKYFKFTETPRCNAKYNYIQATVFNYGATTNPSEAAAANQSEAAAANHSEAVAANQSAEEADEYDWLRDLGLPPAVDHLPISSATNYIAVDSATTNHSVATAATAATASHEYAQLIASCDSCLLWGRGGYNNNNHSGEPPAKQPRLK